MKEVYELNQFETFVDLMNTPHQYIELAVDEIDEWKGLLHEANLKIEMEGVPV